MFFSSRDDNRRSIDPAKFYIILKIHKSPMAARPIAASHSYFTRRISILGKYHTHALWKPLPVDKKL